MAYLSKYYKYVYLCIYIVCSTAFSKPENREPIHTGPFLDDPSDYLGNPNFVIRKPNPFNSDIIWHVRVGTPIEQLPKHAVYTDNEVSLFVEYDESKKYTKSYLINNTGQEIIYSERSSPKLYFKNSKSQWQSAEHNYYSFCGNSTSYHIKPYSYKETQQKSPMSAPHQDAKLHSICYQTTITLANQQQATITSNTSTAYVDLALAQQIQNKADADSTPSMLIACFEIPEPEKGPNAHTHIRPVKNHHLGEPSLQNIAFALDLLYHHSPSHLLRQSAQASLASRDTQQLSTEEKYAYTQIENLLKKEWPQTFNLDRFIKNIIVELDASNSEQESKLKLPQNKRKLLLSLLLNQFIYNNFHNLDLSTQKNLVEITKNILRQGSAEDKQRALYFIYTPSISEQALSNSEVIELAQEVDFHNIYDILISRNQHDTLIQLAQDYPTRSSLQSAIAYMYREKPTQDEITLRNRYFDNILRDAPLATSIPRISYSVVIPETHKNIIRKTLKQEINHPQLNTPENIKVFRSTISLIKSWNDPEDLGLLEQLMDYTIQETVISDVTGKPYIDTIFPFRQDISRHLEQRAKSK